MGIDAFSPGIYAYFLGKYAHFCLRQTAQSAKMPKAVQYADNAQKADTSQMSI